MKHRLLTPSTARGSRRQRGFTLVEMMVAVSIGLIIALGFTVSFVNLKATWGTQDKLAQLQDNERLAMSYLTTSIEEAGYFVDSTPPGLTKVTAIPPVNNSSTTNYGSVIAGQFVKGTIVAGSVPVSLSTVYQTASGDGILTCQGATNSSGATVTIRNVFYVDATKHTLSCLVASSTGTLDANPAELVSNVDSMDVLYAVDTNADGNADTYLAANNVTDWTTVKAVRVTVNFINPNAALGAGAATIPWTQTINLMNNR
jgi:type IV pilus assembly protein PilW